MRRRVLPIQYVEWALVLAFALLGTVFPSEARERTRFQPVANDLALKPLPPEESGKIQFAGNKAFNEQQLREALADAIREINEGGLTRPRADDAAYYLGVHYRKQGYAKAEVRWEIRGSRLVLTISEGPRTYLREILFVGNKQESKATLFEYMIGETGERLLHQPEKFPFVEADIQTGVARIRGLYESEGRLEAVVSDPEFAYSGDGASVDVTVKIVEGPRYTFGEVVFAGKPLFERPKLIEALGEPLSVSYTTQRVNAMQHNLLFFYKLQGYYAAKVEVAHDAKTAKAGRLNNKLVPVTFTIQPGPLYRFDGVKVTGLDRLRPGFMEKRFKSLKGKTYNPTKLDEKFREVLRTGLFKNLRVNTTPLPTNEVRIDLTAEEAKAKEVGFSLGFSSYDGLIFGLRLADRNFLGNGRPLALNIDYSTRTTRAELLYVDPWWYDSDYALRARIFVQDRTEEGYAYQEQGIRADVTRKFNPHFDLSTFLQAKNVGITEALIEPLLLGPTSYQIITLGLTQTYDFRDNPINPSKGWVATLGLDGDALAGELAFGRATVRLSYYLPIQRRFLLALGVRGGLIYPLTSVPITERYFNGGGTTVRSFRERELGPKDRHGYPIGGEAFTVFNAEFIIPIRDALSAALFADAGNVSAQLENAGFDEMRYALGVGLRYKLPIGPVRLDLGFNPNPKNGEDWGAIHFSFGFAF